MKKNKLTQLLVVLTFVMLFSCMCLTACGGVSIAKFELEAEVTAKLGAEFTLPSAVIEDSNGERLFPTISVVDGKGQTIEVTNNKFFITDLGGYNATYTVKYGEDKQETKTLKIKVVDDETPIVKLPYNEILVVKGKEFTLPAAIVTDNSGEKLDYAVSVKFGASDVALVNGTFTPTQEGEYLAIYEAKDSSNKVGKATLTITSAYKENTALYFGFKGGDSMASAPDTATVSSSEKIAFNAEEYSLNVNNTSESGWTDVLFTNPAISDISQYNCMYFYIYNNTNASINVSTNQIFNPSTIESKEWGLIEIYLENGKWVKNSFASGDKFAFATSDAKNPATAQNIDKFKIVFEAKPATNLDVYFSNVMLAKTGHSPNATLPNIPLATKDVAMEIPLATFASSINEGAVSLSGISIKHGNEVTKIEKTNEKYLFTPTEYGAHSVIYTFVDDTNKITNFASKKFIVADLTQIPNQIIPLGQDYALSMLQGNGNTTLSIVSNEFELATQFDKVLKVKSTAQEYTDIKFITPAITDVSERASISYFIYNPMAIKLNALVNGLGGAKENRILLPKTWTQVEYSASDFDANIFNSANVNYAQNKSNITNFTIHILNGAFATENTEVFITTPMANMQNNNVDNTINQKDVSFVNESVTLSAPVVGANVTTTVKVYDPDLTVVTLTDNSFTPTKLGDYTISYLFVENGKVTEKRVSINVIIKTDKINQKIFNPSESMDQSIFLNASEEKITIINDANYVHAGDTHSAKISAKADGAWIDFSIKLANVDLTKVDRLTFYVMNMAANCKGAQIFLKSNGADRLLAKYGDTNVNSNAVANLMSNKWAEINIFKDQFDAYFGSTKSNLAELHFLIDPNNGEGYQSMYYEFAFSSIVIATEQKAYSLDSKSSLTDFDKTSTNIALLDDANFMFGNDTKAVKLTSSGWIDFSVNVANIDLATTNNIFFYVMRTANNSNGAVTVQGANGSQKTYTNTDDMLLNKFIKINISKADFATVFGADTTCAKIKIIINNTASDGVSYDAYQFFMSSIFVD